MDKARTARVILFFLPMIVIIGLALARKKPVYHSHHDGPPPKDLVVKNLLLDKWAAQSFTNFDSTNIAGIAHCINVAADNPFAGEEREALSGAVGAMISYFNSGTYEDYLRFRFVAQNCALSESMSNFCHNALAAPATDIAENPKQVLQKYWDAKMTNRLSNFWIGLSLENSKIQVRHQTNFEGQVSSQTIVPLQKMAKDLPNVGILSVGAGAVRYTPTPAELIAKYKAVDVANVTLLPKTGDNDVVYPVYVTLYWSPDDGKWLPAQMSCGYSGVPRKRTLWF